MGKKRRNELINERKLFRLAGEGTAQDLHDFLLHCWVGIQHKREENLSAKKESEEGLASAISGEKNKCTWKKEVQTNLRDSLPYDGRVHSEPDIRSQTSSSPPDLLSSSTASVLSSSPSTSTSISKPSPPLSRPEAPTMPNSKLPSSLQSAELPRALSSLLLLADNGGSSLLHRAAGSGNVDTLSYLLHHTQSPDVRDKTNKTPLHDACMNGQQATVRVLLEAGAGVDFRKTNGWTGLMFAALHNHCAIIPLLLRHGAEVDARNKENATALYLACREGHTAAVTCLLRAGADVHSRTRTKRTPLLAAISSGNKDVVELLSRNGADLDVVDSRGLSIWHQCAIIGSCDVWAVLWRAWLERLAQEGSMTAVSENKVDLEAEKRLADSLSQMQPITECGQGSSGAQSTEDGREEERLERLRRAMCKDESECVSENMLNKDQTIPSTSLPPATYPWNILVDINRRSALHHAVVEDNTNFALFLLREARADVECEDEDGSTPLYLAACKGSRQMVQLLLDVGANVHTKNKKRSALHAAVDWGHCECVQLLLDCGARVEETDTTGKSVRQLAQERGNKSIAELLDAYR